MKNNLTYKCTHIYVRGHFELPCEMHTDGFSPCFNRALRAYFQVRELISPMERQRKKRRNVMPAIPVCVYLELFWRIDPYLRCFSFFCVRTSIHIQLLLLFRLGTLFSCSCRVKAQLQSKDQISHRAQSLEKSSINRAASYTQYCRRYFSERNAVEKKCLPCKESHLIIHGRESHILRYSRIYQYTRGGCL